jgi:ATP-binding protein involved in chromosome partitioning
VFGEGGGATLAADEGLPLLGCIPLEPAVSHGGDTGAPIVLSEGEASSALRAITELLVTELAPPISMSGCSARMLDAALAALDAAD